MKIQKHIEIVRSTRSGLSSMGLKSCEAIYGVLSQHYATVNVTIINSSEDLEQLALKKPDLVFNGMKFIPDSTTGTKIWISQFLEHNNINHTGSGHHAMAYEQNKALAKNRVSKFGVATAKYAVIKKWQVYKLSSLELTYPLFVKPLNLGGGQGIDNASLVGNFVELRNKVMSVIYKQKTPVLVEEYLPGREFSIAILRSLGTDTLITMPIELSAPLNKAGKPLLSQEVKIANEEVVIPVTDVNTYKCITSAALRAFNAIGGRDYGRIDIRMDAAGVPHFLEANLIPSLIEDYGSFPKACVINQDMDYEAMILAIISLAFERTSAGLGFTKPSAIVTT